MKRSFIETLTALLTTLQSVSSARFPPFLTRQSLAVMNWMISVEGHVTVRLPKANMYTQSLVLVLKQALHVQATAVWSP